MSKTTEFLKVLEWNGFSSRYSALFELCKWCGWYQKLEVKTLLGTRVKRPYRNCPSCGCPTTITPDEIVYACGVCRRIIIEKFVVSLNRDRRVSSVDYMYECYNCGNTSKITALHLCGDGKLGETDALLLEGEGEPVGFECIRCHKIYTSYRPFLRVSESRSQ